MTLVLETKNMDFLEHIEMLAKQNGVRAVYKDADITLNTSKRVQNLGGIFAGMAAPDKKEMRRMFHENHIG